MISWFGVGLFFVAVISIYVLIIFRKLNNILATIDEKLSELDNHLRIYLENLYNNLTPEHAHYHRLCDLCEEFAGLDAFEISTRINEIWQLTDGCENVQAAIDEMHLAILAYKNQLRHPVVFVLAPRQAYK